jgi:hypothetical protein
LAAGTVGKPVIVLKKGAMLKVKVNDAPGLLPATQSGGGSPANLSIGVFAGNSAYYGAQITSVSKTGREYTIIVPGNVPLKLWAFSRDVTLTDSNAAAVDHSGARIPFQAEVGKDHNIVLNVSGRVRQP